MHWRRFTYHCTRSTVLPAPCANRQPNWKASCSGILAMPDFEIEQRPQQLFVVLPAIQVLGQDAAQSPRVIVSLGKRRLALKMVDQVVAQISAKPLIDGYAEAHLRAIQNPRRNELLAGLAQYPLCAPAPDPEIIRQRGDEFSQFVIEEGDS